MVWPNATDYNAAVQNPQLCFRDDELRRGQAVGDLFGLPRPHSGNFADVYQIQSTDGQSWAVKCFTRPVAGLRPRYHAISAHLRHTQRAFMVEFHFLDEGICIQGQWHPLVKMRWVEGFRLNEFVREHLNKPAILERLAHLWVRLAQELRDADMAHGDLQHGNVLLVPGNKSSSLSLKLIDYDGMFVPALADRPSGEVGHPNYQHPLRLREGGYDRDMDRFAHLLIYTALRSLRLGGEELWQRYDNLENLLFREEDFRQPSKSRLLHELWEMQDGDIRGLLGHLLLASQGPLRSVPALDELVDGSGIRPLADVEEARVSDLLDDARRSHGRKGAARPPLPYGRGSNGRSKPQTAVRAAPIAEAAVLMDTKPMPLGVKTAEMPAPPLLPTQRRSAAEIERDAQPPTPTAARSLFDVALLTDPLISMLSHPVWLATLGAIALVSFLVINVMMWSSAKQPTTAAANRGPALADIQDVVLKSGHRKSIHLDVDRHGNHLALTLRFEGLPDELKAPPLTLPADEGRVSLTLLAPLGIALPPCEARVSLWDGDDKVDEKPLRLSVQSVPRPFLKTPDAIACEAGNVQEFVFAVERNNCREPLQVRLEGLPPQVRQEVAPAANAAMPSVKLSVAAGFSPQVIPLKVQLYVGDVIADSKSLFLNVRERTSPKSLEREQITRVRLKDDTPRALSVSAGENGELQIVLDRGGYQGKVEVQLTDLPNGVTARSVSVLSDSATVTVATTVDAVKGEYRVPLLVRVNEQTVDRRDLTLSVSNPRGRHERVQFSTVDHIQLHGTLYHGWKAKNGMTVLMLHDLGRNCSTPGWKRLAETLQANGHTVLTFDFRGHGDSKKVSPQFWDYAVNKYLPAHEPGLPAAKQPKALEGRSLPAGYMPWLIEDIAAARTYLDLRHDEPDAPVNTFNLIVVGAGQASALGSLWLATEGLRYNGSDEGNKIQLRRVEKLSVLQAVWIGMADPLKLSPFGIHGWLKGAHAKPAVPITFIYGEDDIDTSTLLSEPIHRKMGKPHVLARVRLSGQTMLDTDAQATREVQQYLVKTLGTLRSSGWVPRNLKTLRSFWKIPMSLPGSREQERWCVAKRAGETTLLPVPLQLLNLPPIRGLPEPVDFAPEESKP